jgi:DNA helicase-2/ATP-dependent DNA helicase PcrA
MKYVADLHIHSLYSRSTSKNSNLYELKRWARVKGINVLGTGDFTHPAWFAGLKESLVPDGGGFFTLKEDGPETGGLPVIPQDAPFRFCLQAEISSIYKKNGQTRKVHSVIFAPDLESVARINARLSALGNIKSDGRPILGLDPRNLLEIILEVSPDCHLVPAHIWTPWFSLFGSKSGFDSLTECFEDLSGHIFALETGLSSDPAMNWRVSALDSYSLISNSDAHSPGKLMREANLFETSLSYYDMFAALRGKQGFLGTLEFFPEEGKYHFDGHRKCSVCLDPQKSAELRGICPVCGKPLTIGVMHRVMELADRKDAFKPPLQKDYHSIIPLPEILGEIMGKGPGSKAVSEAYWNTISAFGNEYNVFMQAPLEEIASRCGMLLAEAVKRVRRGEIRPRPGYDGEFGVIKVFGAHELEELSGQGTLFHFSGPPRQAEAYSQAALFTADAVREAAAQGEREQARKTLSSAEPEQGAWLTGRADAAEPARPDREARTDRTTTREAAEGGREARPAEVQTAAVQEPGGEAAPEERTGGPEDINAAAGAAQEPAAKEAQAAEPNTRQREIADHTEGAAMVTAGPGTGKTSTLTSWICSVLDRGRAAAENILAITFTNKAALEMKQRLSSLLGDRAEGITVCTFHALCFDIIRNHFPGVKTIYAEAGRTAMLRYLNPGLAPNDIRALSRRIEKYLDGSEPDTDEETEKHALIYQKELKAVRAVDIAALINEVNLIFEQWPQILAHYRGRFAYLAVDEFQDINPAQYAFLCALIGDKPLEAGSRTALDKGVLAIGDPDQAIYAFRGADAKLFFRFQKDFQATHFDLDLNYRAADCLVQAAGALIAHNSFKSGLTPRAHRRRNGKLTVVRTPDEFAEAEYIAAAVRTLLGGTDSLSVDALGPRTEAPYSFHDIAVLVRTHSLADTLCRVFERQGIPVSLGSEYSLLDDPPFSVLASYLHLLYNKQDVIAFRELVGAALTDISADELAALTWVFGQQNGSRRDMLADRALRKALTAEHAAQFEELINFLEFVEVSMEFQGIHKGLFLILEKILPPGEQADTRDKGRVLLELARTFQGDLAGFLRSMFLCTFESQGDFESERVRLLTFHAAKGLEFPVVIIAGAEEGITPLTGKTINVEEERRLFYVALTRARDLAYITCAAKRTVYGSLHKQTESRFIDEIPSTLKEEITCAEKERRYRQPRLF